MDNTFQKLTSIANISLLPRCHLFLTDVLFYIQVDRLNVFVYCKPRDDLFSLTAQFLCGLAPWGLFQYEDAVVCNIRFPLYKDKMASQPSYLYNENVTRGKHSLY